MLSIMFFTNFYSIYQNHSKNKIFTATDKWKICLTEFLHQSLPWIALTTKILKCKKNFQMFFCFTLSSPLLFLSFFTLILPFKHAQHNMSAFPITICQSIIRSNYNQTRHKILAKLLIFNFCPEVPLLKHSLHYKNFYVNINLITHIIIQIQTTCFIHTSVLEEDE